MFKGTSSDSSRFLYLMGNAAKFTPAGEIEISLPWKRSRIPLKLHVIIRDTGIGIPKDKLNDIFWGISTSRWFNHQKVWGHGAGLSICKQIAHAMGGNVWAESELKKEAVFTLRPGWKNLNIKRIEDGMKIHFPAKNPPCWYNLTHLEILGGDRVRGDACDHSHRGEEVLSMLRKAFEAGDPFDLCFIDLQMPHQNGYEVAEEIDSSDTKSLSHRPLFLFGAKCLKMGGERVWWHFGKPVRREKLFQVLEQCLVRWKRSPILPSPCWGEGWVRGDTVKAEDAQDHQRKNDLEGKTWSNLPTSLLRKITRSTRRWQRRC